MKKRTGKIRPSGSLLKGLLLGIVLSAVSVGILYGITVKKAAMTTIPRVMNLENIGELATQSAFVTQIVDDVDYADFFGLFDLEMIKSVRVFSQTVEFKAGYDFEEITYLPNEEEKSVDVYLPAPKILSRELITDTRSDYIDYENPLVPLTMDHASSQIQECIQKAEETAVCQGIMENAAANAETLIKGFLAITYPQSEYTYYFHHSEPSEPGTL